MRAGRLLSILTFILCVPSPAAADVFWKLADAGPKAPDVGSILGDDSRTLALTATGVYEYRFGAWARTPLSAPGGKPEVPGAPFFAGGAFFALEGSGGFSPSERTLYRLSSNAWQTLATFSPSGDEFTHDAAFLYTISGRFNDCAAAPSGACAAGAPARLVTISLADGTRRDGPLLPVCHGRLMAAGGKVYLVGVQLICGGPSVRKTLASTETPLYRLDGGAWTALAPLTDYAEYSGFSGTPRGLWIAAQGTNVQSAVRLLDASGLSAPILLPRGVSPYSKAPVEWGAEVFYLSDDPSGNVFHLVNGAFVPFDPLPPMQLPYGRHVEIHAAGSRLFATGDGYDPEVLSGGFWSETPGIEGTAGADTYLASASAAFASRGGTFWKRTASSWTPLPTPPIGTQRYEGVVWQERPVLVDRVSPGRLLVYSEASGTWNPLVILGSTESLLVSGTALCMTTATQLGCLRDGAWSFAALPKPGPFDPSPQRRLRDLDGTAVVVTLGNVYRLEDETLNPLLTDLPSGLSVRDVASADGRAYLLVGDFRPSSGSVPRVRAVVAAAGASYPAVLTGREDLLYSLDDPSASLSVTQDRLFISRTYPTMAATLRDGRLRQARGGAAIGYLDRSGLFASTGSNDLGTRGALLLPVTRVRKTLPAVVDTIGQGGVHFRTALALANFSPDRPALAHVVPVAHPEAAVDVPLPPMTQSRLPDPFPDFVGPVAVDFDGLDDEREAWASARVFSAVGAGTAGTSLDAADPGSASGFSYLLSPVPEPGTRSHVAVANAGDGAGLPLAVGPGAPVAPGELRQRDLDADETSRTLVVSSGGATSAFPTDDLLGYAVRNDGTTNDGTVVPMEPPDCEVTRRVRFLPAVVSLTSDTASYRTELRFARNNLHVFTAGFLPFHVLYRSESVSGEFDVEVDAVDATDVPDAGAWLARNGVAVDPTHVDGTLTFTSGRPEGAADLLVTAAVFATPASSGGDFGVSVPVANEGRWASTSTVVPGLLEDGAFRSNLAVANPEPPGGPSVTLSVTLQRAAGGAAVGSLPPVVLQPGERYQFNRVSRRAGLGGSFDGYAVVRRTAGAGRFVAYGVLNDEATSDGTLLSMTRIE